MELYFCINLAWIAFCAIDAAIHLPKGRDPWLVRAVHYFFPL